MIHPTLPRDALLVTYSDSVRGAILALSCYCQNWVVFCLLTSQIYGCPGEDKNFLNLNVW